jgi:aspartate-semialdehyde dehydrogenase
MTIAIVGVTGAVGQEIVQVLEKRAFPVKKLRCFASSQSAGKKIFFKNEPIEVEALAPGSLSQIDCVFFCAGKKISSIYAPLAVQNGSLVIDSSSAFRMDSKVPLVIPEINGDRIASHQGIIASPNCTATMMLMVAAPLHRHIPIERIVMSTYQAASGAGLKAVDELLQETSASFDRQPFERTVMPYPYAFNLFSHNSSMTSSHYNEEEIKVIEESRKILDAPELKIGVNCVRVPILRAHSEFLNIEFKEPFDPLTARQILEKTTGIRVLEDWELNRFPMPSDASGKDEVFVGKIRRDLSKQTALDLWVVGDQLLKGAALNAVQIAEHALKFQLNTQNKT